MNPRDAKIGLALEMTARFHSIEESEQAYQAFVQRFQKGEIPADLVVQEIDPSVWCCKKKEFRQHDEKNKYDMTFYIYERH